MQIGTILHGEKKYTVTKNIAADDRPNANVYLCTDSEQKQYIAKHFYNNKPMPVVGFSKYNHFGRRRDGSHLVFNEIKEKSQKHIFLIDHIERFKHDGKWVIILEHVPGITFDKFIKQHKNDLNTLIKATESLAKTISIWHRNGFAHGDPHLNNCMINENNGELIVSLIDYCQLHHQDFQHCQKYNCFKSDRTLRFRQDIKNDGKHFGDGFRQELEDFEIKSGYTGYLTKVFDTNYSLV